MDLTIINAILLFALTIPLVMEYRILPIEGTPYWLFGLLFGFLILNVVIVFFGKNISRFVDVKRLQLFLVWGSLLIALGGPLYSAMIDRTRTAPGLGVHDILLQQEAAMRLLVVGKNPYKETYFGTPVESFYYAEEGKETTNPALYHFVMPPWYLLFPFLFYFPSTSILGFFDGRMVTVFCMVVTIFLLYRWFRNKELGIFTILVTALSPATVDYFIEGRSDVFVLPWLVGALMTLEKRKYILSGILFGLALMSKQTTWILVPYFLTYVWLARRDLKPLISSVTVVLLVVAILAFPFILWDGVAFINSTILYLSGNTPTSYPVSGYGLGMILRQLGYISDIHAYYPFIIWQIALTIPILLISFRELKKNLSISTLLMVYGLTLFVFWYASRYFNNSHIGFLSWIFALSLTRRLDEQTHS